MTTSTPRTPPNARLAALSSNAWRLARTPTASQTAAYAAASAGASVLNGIAKALAAIVLPVGGFAIFAFSQTVLNYLAMLFEFGLFLPAARASAMSDETARRDIVGAALVLYLPVAAGFVAATFACSFVVDDIFHVHAGSALRAVAVIAVGWPFTFVGLQLSQGIGRIQISGLTALLGSLVFVCGAGLAYIFVGHTSAVLILTLQNLGVLAGSCVLAWWLRPRFRGLRSRILAMVRDAKSYGFQVYVGRVLSVGTYNMDVLMLAALGSARATAQYVLAGAIATAAGLPISALATALFARMTRLDRIKHGWLTVAWCIGLAIVPLTWLATDVLVGPVFASTYGPVVTLVVPLTLASAVRGVTGLYNSFLAAHGRGAELRNAGLALTLSNLILNFALIPPFGASGAAWASLAALLVNLGAHIIGYRRVRRAMDSGGAGLSGGLP